MFGGIGSGSLTFDAELYKEDPKVYELACVIRDEIGSLRVIHEGQRTPPKNRLVGLLDGSGLPAPWYSYLTNLDLLKHSAARMGCSMREIIERIRGEFSPPNWEALFWMQAFLESVEEKLDAENAWAQREEAAKSQARSELARQNGSGAHKENRANKQFVFDWLKINRSHYKSMSKTAAAIVSLRLVVGEYNTIYGYVREFEKIRSAGKQ